MNDKADEARLRNENRNVLMKDSYLVLNKAMMRYIGIHETIMLSDLLSKEKYFEDKGELDDGWFFNTQQNIEYDTTLNPYHQRKALETLSSKHKVIEIERKGLPAKLYFKIDHHRLKLLITSCSNFQQLDIENFNNYNNNNNNNNNNFSINREIDFDFANAKSGPPQASQYRKRKLRRRNKKESNSNSLLLNNNVKHTFIKQNNDHSNSFIENNFSNNNPMIENFNESVINKTLSPDEKTNYLESYPHEDVKSIFRYWCQKSPPLIKHSPTSKTCFDALEAINWAMNSGASEHDIRRAIDNYAYLLDTNTKVQTAAAAKRLGWRVGLNEFFTYSDFTVSLAKKKHIKLPVDSWFVECLNDREELMVKYGRLVEDQVPSYTKKIREYWKKIMKKEVIGPDEENAFRKAAVMLDEFRRKKGLAGDKTFNLTKADDMVRLLFEALEKDIRGNWARVSPGWLCSKRTYENRLPAYLIDLGYDYYGAYNDVDSIY